MAWRAALLSHGHLVGSEQELPTSFHDAVPAFSSGLILSLLDMLVFTTRQMGLLFVCSR